MYRKIFRYHIIQQCRIFSAGLKGKQYIQGVSRMLKINNDYFKLKYKCLLDKTN